MAPDTCITVKYLAGRTNIFGPGIGLVLDEARSAVLAESAA
jgi:hypothetical protein